uniref:Capping protein, Arp2/3 and myosin-I linker protein 2 isoform X2 n=1 Tax=Pogona vitticeps TaxID=103695 RepID=A0A6J0V2F1_9SAUR
MQKMDDCLKNIPAELYDTITNLLVTEEFILLNAYFQAKSKTEDIILILMPWRALVVPKKLPFKVQESFSFLAVHLIKVGKANQIVIETDESSFQFEFSSLDELEHMVIHVVTSLKRLFPDSSPGNLLQHASLSLLAKIQRATDSLEELLKEKQGPCGGFSETYAALCDYTSLPIQEEIQWDVDNIYHGQESREFNLQDFSHLQSQDLALSVAALSCNRWFTKLCCKDFKLNPDIVKQILHVLGKSVILEELTLENCSLKFDFAQEMVQVLRNHPHSALNSINLSRNLLEDRGIIALSQIFEQFIKSPQSLNFAKTYMTPKGINALCLSLVSSGLFRTSLCHLDLSGNPGSLVSEGTGGLSCLLKQPNALSYLDLSGTDCALDVIFDALASGCCENLIHLKLSKNIYTYKRKKNVPSAISDFFSNASVLQHVSLAGTKLPPEALRAVLQGLAYNIHLNGLHLDLSSCELGSAGAQVIQDLVSDANICDLNLSDNGFDCDIVTLVLAISRSRSIKHVGLGKNFNIRSRATLVDTLHRIVQLTQDEDCFIQSISVADSHLKMGTSIILDGLRSSRSSLAVLDISGNGMGDTGAKLLAKALSVNTTLRTLIWDRNNTMLCGFLHFTHALERNFTLKIMPLPMVDVTQVYRSNPEKMNEIVHKIQSYLARNQMKEALVPKERQKSKTYNGNQEKTMDAYHYMKTHIEMLSSVQDVEVKADIQQAEEVIEDSNLSTDYKLAVQWEPSCSMDPMPTLAENSLSALAVKAEAEEKQAEAPRAELSLRGRASAKSRPAATKDAEAGRGRLLSAAPPSAPSLMDLPTAGEKLEHYSRDRPRPNRRNRQPPSKPRVQVFLRENDEDRSIARLDEGLDEFFTKKVIHELLPPVSLETSLAAATSTSSGSRTFKKKIGHFFAFKKPKSSWGIRPEKEPESNPVAARSRKSMLSDILRTQSKANQSIKVLSKSDEDGLAAESRGYLEQSQTPDSGRRVKPKYSREGKSQSLILLSGEDEEGLGVQHEKKRPFEKSDVELPSSFEQRVHVMLHRIGVTKVLTSEGKKKQSKDGEIKKAGSDGDIVDSSAEAPCSLKSRTHSMSTDPSVRINPTDIAGRTDAEPSGRSSEGRLSWKALGRQLNVELKGKCSELSYSPRRAFAAQETASHTEQKERESWSSSLPRTGRSTPLLRRTSIAGEGQSCAGQQNLHGDVNTIAEDNQLKAKPHLKPVANRRAMSVHEEQLRDQACVAELQHAKIPHCLQPSPILKWKSKPKFPLEPEASASSDRLGTPSQGRNMEVPESKLRPEMGEKS